ncbi:hypothetical protein D9M68_947520 [compost metagenome]
MNTVWSTPKPWLSVRDQGMEIHTLSQVDSRVNNMASPKAFQHSTRVFFSNSSVMKMGSSRNLRYFLKYPPMSIHSAGDQVAAIRM